MKVNEWGAYLAVKQAMERFGDAATYHCADIVDDLGLSLSWQQVKLRCQLARLPVCVEREMAKRMKGKPTPLRWEHITWLYVLWSKDQPEGGLRFVNEFDLILSRATGDGRRATCPPGDVHVWPVGDVPDGRPVPCDERSVPDERVMPCDGQCASCGGCLAIGHLCHVACDELCASCGGCHATCDGCRAVFDKASQ